MAGLKIADGARIDPAFSAGRPGPYTIRITIDAVPMASAKRDNLDPVYWNDKLRNAGIDATVSAVRFVASVNPRSLNPAAAILADMFGRTGSGDQFVADMVYDVDLTLHSAPTSRSMSGLGAAVQVTAGAVLAVIAAGFVIYEWARNKDMTIGGVVGRQVADAASEAGRGAAELGKGIGVGVLWIGLGVAALLYLTKKGGLRVSRGGVSTGN